MALGYRQIEPEEGVLPAILELVDNENRCPDPLFNTGPRTFYERLLAQRGIWGAFDGDRLAGFALLTVACAADGPSWGRCYLASHVAPDVSCGFIRTVIVHPDYRHRGIGEAFVRLLAVHTDAIGLGVLLAIVHPANTGSLKMLGKNGLAIVQRIERYSDGRPRLLLCRNFERTRDARAERVVA